MPKNNHEEAEDLEKLNKTLIVAAGANTLAAVLLSKQDKSWSLPLLLLLNLGLIYKFHEDGKKKRPLANAKSNLVGFFADDKEVELENDFNNVITGGSAAFDATVNLAKFSK